MSAALLDDLLADFTAPAGDAHAAPTPAKAAKAANREHPCGPAPVFEACEALRISANLEQPTSAPEPDSQKFAAVRRRQTGPQSEQTCGSSQDSQLSQGCPLTWAPVKVADEKAVAWADADITRFLERRARLMRWGWSEPEAEKLAERLVKRDRDGDDRVSCTDCRHYRSGRCGNQKAADLHSPEVGRDLAALLQRCPGFGLKEQEKYK